MVFVGAWQMDPSLSRKECSTSVVSDYCAWYNVGLCARTTKECGNKLTSYVCDQNAWQVPYICQKKKKGMFVIKL